jgi:hypothetical protein
VSEELVFLAEVGDNSEAAILRGYLEDHGIFCYVQGENHRSMLGMVGTYISLRLMVPSAKLEEAQGLLEAFYAEDPEGDAGPEFRGPFRDGDQEDEEEDSLDHAHLAQKIRRARSMALLFPFGGGHLTAGAPVRGLVLAAAVAGAVVLAISRGPAYLLAVPLAILMDWGGVPDAARQRAERTAREQRRRARAGSEP